MQELDQVGLIRTYTGEYLNFFDPQPEQISIESIAIGLARTPRFAGQCKNFYSVASHSMMVSDRIWELTQNKEMALMGLLVFGFIFGFGVGLLPLPDPPEPPFPPSW